MPFIRGVTFTQDEYDSIKLKGYSEKRIALEVNYAIVIKSYFKAQYSYDTHLEFVYKWSQMDDSRRNYGQFIHLVMVSLWESCIINLSQLIDDEYTGKYKNLSLSTFINELNDMYAETPNPDLTLHSVKSIQVAMKQPDVLKLIKEIKNTRRKLTAHNDYDVYDSFKEYFQASVITEKPGLLMKQLEPNIKLMGICLSGAENTYDFLENHYTQSSNQAEYLLDNLP